MSTDTENGTELDVSTFEAAFANNPDKDDWRAFGDEARETFDSSDTGVKAISLSVRLFNLMQKNQDRLGDKYARKDFVKLADQALTLCNVPSGVNANQLIPLVWIVKLDKSIPGEPGKPRTWAGSVSDPSWYGGNLTMGALRVLASKIRRVSGKSEMDQWEFHDGWEPYVREYIKSLRACSLSLAGLKLLISQRENELEAEKDRESHAGRTPEQIAALKEAEALKEHDEKIRKLGSDLLTTYSNAVKELKMDKHQFTKLLRDKGIVAPAAIVPPSVKPTPAEFVKSMTAGDAKALVESIVELIPSDPMRYATILKTLTRACQDAVRQMKSASDNARTAAA
jgi:hypothetical protein